MAITISTTLGLSATNTVASITLPFDPKAKFGKVRQPVRVAINGHTYRSTTFRMGGVDFIPLRKSHQLAAGIDLAIASHRSKKYRITIEPDTTPRTVRVPSDLARALREAGLTKAFASMSFTHRREHVEAVLGANKPETRARWITKCIEMVAAKR
jgi:uncharacterized protein YhdP